MDKDKPIETKQKIKVKADTKINEKLVLKKDFLYFEKQEILVLNKKIKKKFEKENNEIKLASSNIIKLNNDNKKNDDILKISKVSKSLGGKPILKNISFSLKRGHILGLLGPNGAGKSTLFNMIVGKIFPDTGVIKLNNENIILGRLC